MSPDVQLGLWIAQPVLQASVASAMYWRKAYRTFPVFFSYLIGQMAFFGVLFPVNRYCDYETYFYSYWLLQAVSLAWGFKVIHEIFVDVFRPYHTLKDLGSVLFKWAALVMLLVAMVVAAASSAGEQGPMVQAVLTVQRCIRVIQCGLILFLLLFSRYLGVSWRQQSFGIALGFGGYASIELGWSALNASGHLTEVTIGLLNTFAYDLAIVVWLGYMLKPAFARDISASKILMSQRWDQSLSDLQHPATGDSLIPMFEGMVDRALSRTSSESMDSVLADEPVGSIAAPGPVVLRRPLVSKR